MMRKGRIKTTTRKVVTIVPQRNPGRKYICDHIDTKWCMTHSTSFADRIQIKNMKYEELPFQSHCPHSKPHYPSRHCKHKGPCFSEQESLEVQCVPLMNNA